MASRKELKKAVNYIISDMFVEAIIMKEIKHVDDAKAELMRTEQERTNKTALPSSERFLAMS